MATSRLIDYKSKNKKKNPKGFLHVTSDKDISEEEMDELSKLFIDALSDHDGAVVVTHSSVRCQFITTK